MFTKIVIVCFILQVSYICRVRVKIVQNEWFPIVADVVLYGNMNEPIIYDSGSEGEFVDDSDADSDWHWELSIFLALSPMSVCSSFYMF